MLLIVLSVDAEIKPTPRGICEEYKLNLCIFLLYMKSSAAVATNDVWPKKCRALGFHSCLEWSISWTHFESLTISDEDMRSHKSSYIYWMIFIMFLLSIKFIWQRPVRQQIKKLLKLWRSRVRARWKHWGSGSDDHLMAMTRCRTCMRTETTVDPSISFTFPIHLECMWTTAQTSRMRIRLAAPLLCLFV